MTDEPNEQQVDADAEQQARGRALSSPLRLRVLRLCAYEARTNKELAELLEVNPGTMLHHVRTLVQTGFLEPEAERTGSKGAREVPYIATGRSWNTPLPDGGRVLIDTFLQQIEGLESDQLQTVWLGLQLSREHRDELERRLAELAEEFKSREPDPDGEPVSLFVALHTDQDRDRARTS